MLIGPEKILVDSSFFFALFRKEDPWHRLAFEKREWLENFHIIIPWPILYETINSKFVKNPAQVEAFELVIRQTNTTLLDDSKYREDAYRHTLYKAKSRRGAVSLVDSVLHAIIEDINVHISAILTFDRRDFASICAFQGIEII